MHTESVASLSHYVPLMIFSAFLRSVCACQLGPSFIIYQSKGRAATLTKANIVTAQPTLMALIMGTTAVVAAAPSRHRSRLFEAETTPALPGYKSNVRHATQFREADRQNEMTKRNIKGPARLVSSAACRSKKTLHETPA